MTWGDALKIQTGVGVEIDQIAVRRREHRLSAAAKRRDNDPFLGTRAGWVVQKRLAILLDAPNVYPNVRIATSGGSMVAEEGFEPPTQGL